MKNFEKGDLIKHREVHYKARVKKPFKNGKAILTVIDCKESREAFNYKSSRFPFDITGTDVTKWFVKI